MKSIVIAVTLLATQAHAETLLCDDGVGSQVIVERNPALSGNYFNGTIELTGPSSDLVAERIEARVSFDNFDNAEIASNPQVSGQSPYISVFRDHEGIRVTSSVYFSGRTKQLGEWYFGAGCTFED